MKTTFSRNKISRKLVDHDFNTEWLSKNAKKSLLILSLTLSLSMTSISFASEEEYAGNESFKLSYPYPYVGPGQIVFSDHSSSILDSTLPSEWKQVLPVCDIATRINPCIEGLYGKKVSSENWTKFKPGIELHRKPNSFGLTPITPPGSFFPRIWEGPEELETLGGNKYILSATIANKSVLDISVSPINLTTSLYSKPQAVCPWVFQEIECPIKYNFPKDSEFKVVIKFPKNEISFNSWLYGRLSNPVINFTNNADDFILTIQGSPMKVQIARAVVTLEEYQNMFGDIQGPNTIPVMNFDGQNSDYKYYELIDKMQNNSVGQMDSWRIGTHLQVMDNCFNSEQNQFGGMLITNATAFGAFPPKWDAPTKSLIYRIASPHFDPKGNVFLGEYRIILKDTIANCLWGVEASNAKAEISITNNEGISQIATNTIKVQAGYVYLSAQGFHYSESTVKVKLLSNKPKALNIVCSKGKLTKKVTGTNPKCPIGYKIKK